MHRYTYPITVRFENGEKAAGNFVVTANGELTEDQQEQQRSKIEDVLNKEAGNPLQPGAQYVILPAIYKKLRK